jgi:hypothetical protein
MRYYLGTHMPNHMEQTDVPLFVSRRRLAKRKRLPRPMGRWALDSGGFSELSMFGAWQTTPEQYVGEVRRFADEMGGLDWAAVQDWMCEPWITAKTGLRVPDHQRRTTESYQRLMDLAPDLPWVPVLQGWEHADYLRHMEQYAAAGIDLAALPVVGVGSVCRRQHTTAAAGILTTLAAFGLRLHGFGLKTTGLRATARVLASADSMAWSAHARRRPALPGCTTHRSCANCLRYALRWREDVLDRCEAAPLSLFDLVAA